MATYRVDLYRMASNEPALPPRDIDVPTEGLRAMGQDPREFAAVEFVRLYCDHTSMEPFHVRVETPDGRYGYKVTLTFAVDRYSTVDRE